MNTQIEVTYTPRSFQEMDQIDAALETIAGAPIGSGFGGSRDLTFEVANKKTAEKIAEKMGDLFEKLNKEYNIDIN